MEINRLRIPPPTPNDNRNKRDVGSFSLCQLLAVDIATHTEFCRLLRGCECRNVP